MKNTLKYAQKRSKTRFFCAKNRVQVTIEVTPLKQLYINDLHF
jgi:hypothetical protein